MRRNYYYVSVLKDGLTPDQGEWWALKKARARIKKVVTCQWFVKRIGQTPTRWAYRVIREHST